MFKTFQTYCRKHCFARVYNGVQDLCCKKEGLVKYKLENCCEWKDEHPYHSKSWLASRFYPYVEMQVIVSTERILFFFKKIRVRFFGRIQKWICDLGSYGFFTNKKRKIQKRIICHDNAQERTRGKVTWNLSRHCVNKHGVKLVCVGGILQWKSTARDFPAAKRRSCFAPFCRKFEEERTFFLFSIKLLRNLPFLWSRTLMRENGATKHGTVRVSCMLTVVYYFLHDKAVFYHNCS